MLELEKIKAAHETIKDFVYKTPFSLSTRLSKAMDAKIYLKEENLQITGAYKVRGAFNKIANLLKNKPNLLSDSAEFYYFL